MKLSQRAQLAIEHARKTTNTLQWCGVGVFSGDGKKGLDSKSCRVGISDAVKEFIIKDCIRFTPYEMDAARVRFLRRMARYSSLIIIAVQQGNFLSAKELADRAESARSKAREIGMKETMYFRIKDV